MDKARTEKGGFGNQQLQFVNVVMLMVEAWLSKDCFESSMLKGSVQKATFKIQNLKKSVQQPVFNSQCSTTSV